MAFECTRCGVSFAQKQHLLTHWKRKKPCSPVVSNVTVDELLAKHQEHAETKKNVSCSCGKRFSSEKSLNVHVKTCTHDMASRIHELEKALHHATIQNIVNNTTNNNTTNNTTNNIQNINVVFAGDKINAFGHESYDHISDDRRKSCLKQLTEGIYKLCHEIYATPENQNVRVHKKGYLHVYNGKEWDLRDTGAVTRAIVANTCTFGKECYLNEEYGLQKWDEDNADGGMYYIRHALANCENSNRQEYHQFRRAILANLHDMKEKHDKLASAENASLKST